MKVIQLSKALTLKTGLIIPSGCIVAPLQTYFDITKLNKGNIPAQFGIAVYIDQNAYTNKLQPVSPNDITDFQSLANVSVLMTDYVNKGADNIAAQAVKQFLIDSGIASGKITIIDL